ncbi:TlpA family protein disulfide reductase, partial [Singulisphaera rosea]
RARRRGGLVVIPKDPEAAVEIRLGPLVRVFGSFEGPGLGQQPAWTHVYINLPEYPSHPIDSPRIVSCGSFEAKLDVRLPLGSYSLQAYSQFADQDLFEGELVPDRPIELKGDVPELDLGRLILAKHGVQMPEKIAKAKSEGIWSDYTKHFGEPPPRWHVTEAKGVPKETQPSDFKGKWLLVDFWGFSCRPCLKTGLPKLMAFDEAHAAQRDQYQILTVCIEDDGSVASMADVDRRLAPILEHVWGRKTFPFPILLDTTFRTWERFGLPGLGTVILIDPDGKLVPGDEKALAERLKEAAS